MINLDKNLISIVIGIRFRANFTIEDMLGKISDQILYGKNSYFDSKFFPLVKNGLNEKTLFNKETNNYLQINNSNVILEFNINNETDYSKINQIHDHFENQIILRVLKEFGVTQINRIGYIRRYLFENKDLAQKFLLKSTGTTIEGVNDINLTFSKRYPSTIGLAKESIYDYDNAIYNVIKKADKEELFIALDYQRYFAPFLESSSQIGLKGFLTEMERYNSTIFLNWLSKNYGLETEAA